MREKGMDPVTTETTTIDRHSAVPYYVQLVEVLDALISRGIVKPGDRLPSESELGAKYELSRSTVRQALQLLVAQRKADRVPGRGVFARAAGEEQRGWMIQGHEGFLEDAILRHQPVSTTVLSARTIALPLTPATALGVAERTTGFELVRLRSVAGDPALHSVNFLPPPVADVVARAQDVLDGTGSLGKLFWSAGYRTGGAQRTMHALPAPARIADSLGVEAGVPLLRVRSTSWDHENRIYDYYETWVRTDIVPLEVRVDSVLV